MSNYQLELKQIVAFPRCRIYRQFIRSLMEDRNIRTNGCSGLFYFMVLCSFANYQTSTQSFDGIRYTVLPGEWICRVTDLPEWFRVRTQRKALSILKQLQERHLIEFTMLGRGKLVKFKIKDWTKSNKVIEDNAPCQKDMGFFFFPISKLHELIGAGRCSEMDIILDLWMHAIYNDARVQGSELGPLVYFRNYTGSPLTTYADMAARWDISKTSVCRLLKKLEEMDYLHLIAFPGRHGTAIYLSSYLSTMFNISDVMIDKEELAFALNIHVSVPAVPKADSLTLVEDQVSVPKNSGSVPKSHILVILQKVAQILATQGFSCSACTRAAYILSSLSPDCEGKFKLQVGCENSESEYFTLRIVKTPEVIHKESAFAVEGGNHHGK